MLVRPPRMHGYFQLFDFMVSDDDLLNLAYFGFGPAEISPAWDYGVQCRHLRSVLPAISLSVVMHVPGRMHNNVQIIALRADSQPDYRFP